MKTTSDYQTNLSNIKVSTSTQGFLHCILLLSDLSSNVYESLLKLYCENESDRVYNLFFVECYRKMEDVFFGFLADSIRDKIFDNELNEI